MGDVAAFDPVTLALPAFEPPPGMDGAAFASELAELRVRHLERSAAAAKAQAREASLRARTKAEQRQARKLRSDSTLLGRQAQLGRAAVLEEQAAEAIVPAAQRHAIVVPLVQVDGGIEAVVLREARWAPVARRTGQFRRASVLRTLAKRGTLITVAHIAAADAYERVHEAVGGGAFRSCLEEKGGGGTASSGNWAIEHGLGSDATARAVRAALGKTGCSILDHVVLRNGDVSGWAQTRGVGRDVAMGMLVCTLDVLVETLPHTAPWEMEVDHAPADGNRHAQGS